MSVTSISLFSELGGSSRPPGGTRGHRNPGCFDSQHVRAMGSLSLASPPTRFSRILLTRPVSRNAKQAKRSNIAGFRVPKCTADLSLGGGDNKNFLKFPRMNVWDPYKRLGITSDASEEEIWGARNFLREQYAGHERSMESIEAAFEKIFMASFRKRKKSKINLKSRLRNKIEESPSWVKRLVDCVELPPIDVILRRLFLFAFMGVWSVINSAEAGPAFQVALSLGSCIYFLNDKMKDVKRALITGFGALVLGWLCGSIVVPMIPTSLLRPTWTLELLTSLFCYVSLFLACTFIK